MMPILVSILIVALTVDMVLSSFLDVLHPHLPATFQIILFTSIAVVIYSTGQKMLAIILRNAKGELQHKTDLAHFGSMGKSVVIINYAIAATIALVVLQMVIFSEFNVILGVSATVTSFIPASIMMAILAYNLLRWYKISRNAAVLFYALSATMVCTALGLNAVIYSGLLLDKPPIVEGPQEEVQFSEISQATSGLAGALYFVGWMPFLLGFMFTWAGTAFLMRDRHTHTIGKTKLWIIISLPMLAYLIAIIPTMMLISQNKFVFDDPSLIAFRTLFKTAVVAGALFFGVIFFILSRTIRKLSKTTTVASYVIMAGYGITMTTILLASPVYHATYPPFGIASSSFVAFTSYLVSIGFYYSAVSISKDALLRSKVKKIAAYEVQLLDNITSAQVEVEITEKVMHISKKLQKEMAEQTGIPPSLNEDEIRDYVEEVFKEIKDSSKQVSR